MHPIRFSSRFIVLPMLGALFSALALFAAHAQTTTRTVPDRAAIQPSQIEAMLLPEIQGIVDRQTRLEGQEPNIRVKLRYDADAELLYVDLGRGFIPRDATYISGQLEEQMHEISVIARHLLVVAIPNIQVLYRFDGKDIYHYFPHERPASRSSQQSSKAMDGIPKPPSPPMIVPPEVETVVVSAGHGLYYHHGYRDWRTQRDPHNGITEDFLTPDYAAELALWLGERSSVAVDFPRSTEDGEHAPSGQAWWKVAARYHLQRRYPHNPEVWHSLPDATHALREYDEDIRSRPLFANRIARASALIHIHTNAADDPNVSGTQVYINPESEHIARDQPLARNVLCYMKELIQAQQNYQNFSVDTQPRVEDKGENRLAEMPSVIVEIAFHTNVGDAAALRDPVFRTAAMKGVEKGLRLTRQGETECQPFAIADIPPTHGTHGATTTVSIDYQGFPQFPVVAKVEFVECPPSATCNGGQVRISSPTESPLSYVVRCLSPAGSSETLTGTMRTTLTDADNVGTEPVEHTLICSASG